MQTFFKSAKTVLHGRSENKIHREKQEILIIIYFETYLLF